MSSAISFKLNLNNAIKKEYSKALIPNILLVLGATINVFFDGVLVGQRLGNIGLESVNQCLPFYLILCTIGSLIASGVLSLSAIATGQDDLKESKRIYSVGLFLSLIVSIFTCLLTIILIDPISLLLSHTDTYEYVKDYLLITAYGGVFKVLIYNFTFYLRLEGKLKRSSFAMILMTVLNIGLDALFLFVFDFGIKGAAWASTIATIIACLLCFFYLYTDKPTYNLAPKLPKKGDLFRIIKYGSAMAVNNICSSLKIFFFNQIFKGMAQPSLIFLFAIINNLSEFTICVQNGVPQTATAMEGVLYGGKEYISLKRIVRLQVKYGFRLSLFLALIIIASSKYIPIMFGGEVSDLATYSLNIPITFFALSLLFATINSIFIYYYSSILKHGLAALLSILKGLIVPVLALLLCKGLEDEMLWVFYPISELIVFLCIFLFSMILKNEHASLIYLLDEKFEMESHIYTKEVAGTSEEVSAASQGVSEFCETFELSPKKTMAISLSIEELLLIIVNKSLPKNDKIDLRVLMKDDDVIIRVRSGGRKFNPFDNKDADSLDYLGVEMIRKIAKSIDYQTTLGLNTLIIRI